MSEQQTEKIQEEQQTAVVNSSLSPSSPSQWSPCGDLSIYKPLFNKGLVVVKSQYLPEVESVNDNQFKFKERNFQFYSLAQEGSSNIGNVFNDSLVKPKAMRYLNATMGLLEKLVNVSNSTQKISMIKRDVLINNSRREEVFLPCVLQENTQKDDNLIGIYLYPWLSETKKSKVELNFSGFTQFVTAGCMFGSTLKGMDQHGATFALIKHDIEFFAKQKIQIVKHKSDALSPYEEMLFEAFEKSAVLINALKKNDRTPELLYHLPWYDYILFGVSLFMQGRMSLKALNSLIEVIRAKKDVHVKKIKDICKKNNIIVQIESPFDQLFGKLGEKFKAEAILSVLQVPPVEVNPEPSEKEIKERETIEQKVVNNCVEKLKNENFNKKHKSAWEIFSKCKTQPATIENLLQLSNAVMIGVAAIGKENNEVCSLLPLTEKQIPLKYATLCREISSPSVVNITTLEILITYSPTTQGLPFYFNESQNKLGQLIKERKILKDAYKNIGLFALAKETLKLEANNQKNNQENNQENENKIVASELN